MSISQYYNEQYVLIFDTVDSEILMGKATIPKPCYIRHIRVKMFIKDASVLTNESCTVLIKSLNNTDLVESIPVVLSTIGESGDWYGWIRYDFPTYILNDSSYNLYLTISNYTRDADTSYISAVRDYALTTYPSDTIDQISFELFTEKI
jgi:hypothetical protein